MVSLPSFSPGSNLPGAHICRVKTNLCHEEIRPRPRLAKALKCGSVLERVSSAGVMQSHGHQGSDEKASWSKTPWVEQRLRPNPSYWTYESYELELELCPETVKSPILAAALTLLDFMLRCVRALSVDQIKPSVQESDSIISRALTHGARVTNVITHASRVKWSQDCPRLISFQKLERDHSVPLCISLPRAEWPLFKRWWQGSHRLALVYVLSDSHCLI